MSDNNNDNYYNRQYKGSNAYKKDDTVEEYNGSKRINYGYKSYVAGGKLVEPYLPAQSANITGYAKEKNYSQNPARGFDLNGGGIL